MPFFAGSAESASLKGCTVSPLTRAHARQVPPAVFPWLTRHCSVAVAAGVLNVYATSAPEAAPLRVGNSA
jgi:hypothetical protein